MATCKKQDGEAHAIDIGTGSGLLSVLTARAGADSVVACDLHEPLANLARRVRVVFSIPHHVPTTEKANSVHYLSSVYVSFSP